MDTHEIFTVPHTSIVSIPNLHDECPAQHITVQ